MKFDLKTPCNDCPWRAATSTTSAEMDKMRTGIKEMDCTHTCHKTSLPGSPEHDGEQHCAGALLLAERTGLRSNPSQQAIEKGRFDPSMLNVASGELIKL